MAGNTFRGVGKDGASSSRIDEDDDRPRLIDDDDARGLHSGPTVVDDQKVAEVLKKLRSLDRVPGPLTGVTEVVVDANSSEQTRIDSQPVQIDTAPIIADSGPASLEDVMYPLKRATAIGRSPSTPAGEQPVTVPADLARGTLFGHSIHLPDVNAPDATEIELSSGALQPFPLADRPAVVIPPPTSVPAARFHTPFDVDAHTQLVDPARSKTMKRFIAFVGGLSIAGAGVWAWWQYGGGHAASNNPPAVAAPAATSPSIDPMPPSAASPMPPSAAAATAPTPPAAPPTPAAAEAPTPAPAPTPTLAPAAAPVPASPSDEPHPQAPTRASRSRTRHGTHASERHAAAKPAPPPADDGSPGASGKPGHSHKQPAVIEDPDATMAPSD